MPPITCLGLLDPTRRAILVALRRLGSATAEEVAARTFLSVGAARQHLQSLEAQGLITHEPERHGPGHPRHRFLLTPRGESLFPRLDHEALAGLLQAIDDEDHPGLRDRLLRRITERTITRYRPTFEREGRLSPLRGVVAVFEEAGYIPEVSDGPAGPALVLHHCPISQAARASRLLCEAEARCIASAFEGLSVRRTAFRPDGDAACAYIIEPGDG